MLHKFLFNNIAKNGTSSRAMIIPFSLTIGIFNNNHDYFSSGISPLQITALNSYHNQNTQTPARAAPSSSSATSWKCSLCDYVNPAVVRHCNYCGERNAAYSSPASSSSQSSSPSPNTNPIGTDKQKSSLKNNNTSSDPWIDGVIATKYEVEEQHQLLSSAVPEKNSGPSSRQSILRRREGNVSNDSDNTHRRRPSSPLDFTPTSMNNDPKTKRRDEKRGFRLHTDVKHFDWLCQTCFIFNHSSDRNPRCFCTGCNSAGPKAPFHWRCGKCCQVSTSLPAREGNCSHCQASFASVLKCFGCRKPISAFAINGQCRSCKVDLEESASQMRNWLTGENERNEERKRLLLEKQKQQQQQRMPTPMRRAERRIRDRDEKIRLEEEEIRRQRKIDQEQRERQQQQQQQVQSTTPSSSSAAAEVEAAMPMLEDDDIAGSDVTLSTPILQQTSNFSSSSSSSSATMRINEYDPGLVESWVCQDCSECNDASVTFCPSCGSSRPSSASSSGKESGTSTTTTRQDDDDVDDDFFGSNSSSNSDSNNDNDTMAMRNAEETATDEVEIEQTSPNNNSTSSSNNKVTRKGKEQETWKCMSCGNVVSASMRNCPICLQPQPEVDSSVSSSASTKTKATTSSSTTTKSANTWDCPVCRTENFNNRRSCRICSLEANATTRSHQKHSAQHQQFLDSLPLLPQRPSEIAGVKVDDDDTHLGDYDDNNTNNNSSNSRLEADESNNSDGLLTSEEQDNLSRFGGAFKARRQFWTCAVCREQGNPVENNTCIRCEQPRIIKDIQTLLDEQEEAERKQEEEAMMENNKKNNINKHTTTTTTTLKMLDVDGRPLRKTWLCTFCTKWNTSIKPHCGGGSGSGSTTIRCKHCNSDPNETKVSIWLCRSASCTKTHSDKLSLAMQSGVFEYLTPRRHQNDVGDGEDDSSPSTSGTTELEYIRSFNNSNNNNNNNNEQEQQQQDLPKFDLVKSHSWNWSSSIACSHCGDFRYVEQSPSIPFGYFCSECGSTNSFIGSGSNRKCRECASPPAFPGDWKCSVCNAVNFSRRLACRRCAKSRTEELSSAAVSARRWYRQSMERGVKMCPLVFADSESFPVLVAQEKEQALMDEIQRAKKASSSTSTSTQDKENNNNSVDDSAASSTTTAEPAISSKNNASPQNNAVNNGNNEEDSDSVNVLDEDDAFDSDTNEVKAIIAETQRRAAELEEEANQKQQKAAAELQKNKDNNATTDGDHKDEIDDGDEDHSHLFVDSSSASSFYDADVDGPVEEEVTGGSSAEVFVDDEKTPAVVEEKEKEVQIQHQENETVISVVDEKHKKETIKPKKKTTTVIKEEEESKPAPSATTQSAQFQMDDDEPMQWMKNIQVDEKLMKSINKKKKSGSMLKKSSLGSSKITEHSQEQESSNTNSTLSAVAPSISTPKKEKKKGLSSSAAKKKKKTETVQTKQRDQNKQFWTCSLCDETKNPVATANDCIKCGMPREATEAQ